MVSNQPGNVVERECGVLGAECGAVADECGVSLAPGSAVAVQPAQGRPHRIGRDHGNFPAGGQRRIRGVLSGGYVEVGVISGHVVLRWCVLPACGQSLAAAGKVAAGHGCCGKGRPWRNAISRALTSSGRSR